MQKNIIHDYEFRGEPLPTEPRFGESETTGTEKIVIKKTAEGITTKEKSSYHNPVTGVSEKVKV